MRKVLLYFPDVTSLSDFVLTQKVSKIVIDSAAKSIKGVITEKQLHIARKQFGAKMKKSVLVKREY